VSVIVARPPNFEQILKAFPDADKPGVIFSHGWDDEGRRVYNPSGGEIPKALWEHESVHCDRQRAIGTDVWWNRYMLDAEFRYTEELLAHVAEFRAQTSRATDRNIRAKILQSTAARLVAPLYNYQPPRTLAQAMRDLRWEMEQK
jgi:hypothetical protein